MGENLIFKKLKYIKVLKLFIIRVAYYNSFTFGKVRQGESDKEIEEEMRKRAK